ncbi:MAG: hypothetical protein ERJ69_07490 [Aphanocapsa feldmannii 288cV]|nr:MAG: hypothetical protein ERJ69_07490 [Aphanocapsa feldmannii 288cV]
MRGLLEKGGLLEKRMRPAEVTGKHKQAEARAATGLAAKAPGRQAADAEAAGATPAEGTASQEA